MAVSITSSKNEKQFRVSVDGVANLTNFVASLPGVVTKAKDLATIDATRFAFAESSREIRKEIRVTPEYLGNAANGGNRLKLGYAYEGGTRIGVIKGRKRATSLARFILGVPSFIRGAASRVQVKPGGKIVSQIAVKGGSRASAPVFALKLNKGASLTEDNYNVGLAVRLKPGEIPQRKVEFLETVYSKSDPNLVLLYGPSINQVFYDVAPAVSDPVARQLNDAFLRQFERLTHT